MCCSGLLLPVLLLVCLCWEGAGDGGDAPPWTVGVVVDCGGCEFRGDSVGGGSSRAGGATGTVPGAAAGFVGSERELSFSLAGDMSEPDFSFCVSGLCNLI